MSENGWIGVDLDKTLAHYDGFAAVDHIGEPIPLMAERVKTWLEQGRDVRIFTARVAATQVGAANEDASGNAEIARKAIQAWCAKHFGRALPVTAEKDFNMVELWDDLAVRVVPNCGLVSDGSDVEEPMPEPGDIGSAM